MALDEYGVTRALLKPNEATAAEIAAGAISLRASGAWNRLNGALTKTIPRNLERAEQTRRRIAKMR